MQPEVEQGDCGERGEKTQSGEASPNTTVPGSPEVPMDRAHDFPKLALAGLAETYAAEEQPTQSNHEVDVSTGSKKNDPRRPLKCF